MARLRAPSCRGIEVSWLCFYGRGACIEREVLKSEDLAVELIFYVDQFKRGAPQNTAARPISTQPTAMAYGVIAIAWSA